MRYVVAAGWFLCLLAQLIACTSGNSERAPQPQLQPSDAGASDAAQPGSDAAVAASLDIHFLLISAVLETERSLIARCPCLTESGHYESTSECIRAVSLGRDWIDCANALDLTGQDDADVRANLRCNIEELTQRSECLMGSACRDDAIAVCMTQSLGCPMLPLDALSRVAVECMITFSR